MVYSVGWPQLRRQTGVSRYNDSVYSTVWVKKSSLPETFCNIFTRVKYIFIKFSQLVVNIYPHILTNFGWFILIFNQMALILLGVIILFPLLSFEFLASQVALTSSLLMSGPNSPNLSPLDCEVWGNGGFFPLQTHSLTRQSSARAPRRTHETCHNSNTSSTDYYNAWSYNWWNYRGASRAYCTGILSLYTVSQKTSPFIFPFLSKLTDFNDFWCVKSWENLTLIAYTFAHLTCIL